MSAELKWTLANMHLVELAMYFAKRARQPGDPIRASLPPLQLPSRSGAIYCGICVPEQQSGSGFAS